MLNERQFRVHVEYANGDDFSEPRQHSMVHVLAKNETEASLIANQMAMTPQPGKPAHLQITDTSVLS